jgi:putative protease
VAPAGDLESAYAALQYGAGAIYLGLKQFSARAEAANFELDELDHVVSYARSLRPRRSVYVTVNTLLLNRELADAAAHLGALDDIGVDAVIVQDLGVARLARRLFPRLKLHASTQMAVHDRRGVQTLASLGFRRVVLARELTLDEIRECASVDGIGIECFIHGALCYSYSGLCLFSSHATGRSGNRGVCAQVCRNAFITPGAADGCEPGMPFSMKDFALGDYLERLAACGVGAFKIEGRRKSPLYVAAAVDLYGRAMKSDISPADRALLESDLQTVFSRPWTEFHVESPDRSGVVDSETSGHRGALIGRVESVVLRVGSGGAHLRFKTTRRLEIRDGLQIDVPGSYKPFGFSIERLRVIPRSRRGKPRDVCEAPAESLIEVALPDEYPSIPPESPVYCSSSQAVKQRYRIVHHKRADHRSRRKMDIRLRVSAQGLRVTARTSAPGGGGDDIASEYQVGGFFERARDPERTASAVRTAFGKLGDTAFEIGEVDVDNPDGLFVPVSQLNDVRREVVARLQQRTDEARATYAERLRAQAEPNVVRPAEPSAMSRFSVRIDDEAYLEAFEERDFESIEEIVVDVTALDDADPVGALRRVRERCMSRLVRLVFPIVMRSWERERIMPVVSAVRSAGFDTWEASNVSTWSHLGAMPWTSDAGIDLTTDWSVYVMNREAALMVSELGARRFVLSPEDESLNMTALVREFGRRAMPVMYQDTPLFVSEACPQAACASACAAGGACPRRERELVSGFGQKVVAITADRRTTVVSTKPYCISHRQQELRTAGASLFRVEFCRRAYSLERIRDVWRAVCSGERVDGTHEGNYERGLG